MGSWQGEAGLMVWKNFCEFLRLAKKFVFQTAYWRDPTAVLRLPLVFSKPCFRRVILCHQADEYNAMQRLAALTGNKSGSLLARPKSSFDSRNSSFNSPQRKNFFVFSFEFLV